MASSVQSRGGLPLILECASCRDCSLEAMRTQVFANQCIDCTVVLFVHASFIRIEVDYQSVSKQQRPKALRRFMRGLHCCARARKTVSLECLIETFLTRKYHLSESATPVTNRFYLSKNSVHNAESKLTMRTWRSASSIISCSLKRSVQLIQFALLMSALTSSWGRASFDSCLISLFGLML